MHNHSVLFQQAAIAGTVNALINGYKAWSAFRAESQIPLTLDSIAGGSDTVLGRAVSGAFVLGLMVTMITFFRFRSGARKKGIPLEDDLRFWPHYALLMLKNAIFAFGLLIMLAVLLQRWFGTVEVLPVQAAAATGLVAFAVTFYTALSTMRTMLRSSR